MSELLAAEHLRLGYRQRRTAVEVASEMDLRLESSTLVCLLGRNGAGKSTLLRTLAGMQPALSGRVRLLGEDLEVLSPQQLARRLSVVLTENLIPPHLHARMLVSLGRHPHTDWMGRLGADDWHRVDAALEALAATELAERRVSELSDGERQKVLIARALAQNPRLMILDEPTSFLDLPRRIEMLALLKSLTRSEGCSVLLATHHLDLALHYADRLWLLGAEGDLISGVPEDLVLDGSLEDAFAGEGLRFDPERGELRFPLGSGNRRIALAGGDDLASRWTRRALERAGWCVDDRAAVAVEVLDSRSPEWRVSASGDDVVETTLGGVLEAAERLHSADPVA